MKNKPYLLTGLLIALLACCCSAEVMIDDHFDGSAGSPPNPAFWSIDNPLPAGGPDSTVTLDGASSVITTGSNGWFLAHPSFGFTVTEHYGARLTVENAQMGTNSNFGLCGKANDFPYLNYPHINIRDFGAGVMVIDLIPPTYPPYGRKYTSIPPGTMGTWMIEWYTDQVLVYFNGVLQFDSQVDAVGVPFATYPLWPQFSSDTIKIDRVLWESMERIALIDRVPVAGAGNVPVDAAVMWDLVSVESYNFDVYFSENPLTIADAPVLSNTSQKWYAPAADMKYDTTYYWRVDVVDPGTGALVKEGTQFSFTTELAFVFDDPTVMIDDHFDGPAGSPPDPNFWSIDNPKSPTGSDSTVTLDGSSSVITTGSNGWFLSHPSFGFTVNEKFGARLTVVNAQMGTNSNFGLCGKADDFPYLNYPHINIRDIAAGVFVIDLIPPTYPPYFRKYTNIPIGTKGTWIIEWYTGQVLVYFNGILQFDSQIDCPAQPFPDGPLWPQFSSDTIKIDRVIWKYFGIPQITNPSPAPGAVAVAIDANLSWSVPDCNDVEIYNYDVYLGEDPDFTGETPVLDNTALTSYDPPTDFQYNTKYYWRVDVINPNGVLDPNHPDITGPVLMAVGEIMDFRTRVPKAHTPTPAHLATGVHPSQVLSWLSAGNSTYTYDVYFGTSSEDVTIGIPSVFQGNQSETSFDPFAAENMEWSTTYYWRIDQVDTTNPSKIDRGDVWRFTTIVPQCTPPLIFDTNGDCKIDLAEIAALAEDWLRCNWVPAEFCLE